MYLLYRIGTKNDLSLAVSLLPERVFTELAQGVYILDASYGTDRDPLQTGGYALIVETADDLSMNYCTCRFGGTFSFPILGGRWAARRQATLGQGSTAREKAVLTIGHDTENPWGLIAAPWISEKIFGVSGILCG